MTVLSVVAALFRHATSYCRRLQHYTHQAPRLSVTIPVICTTHDPLVHISPHPEPCGGVAQDLIDMIGAGKVVPHDGLLAAPLDTPAKVREPRHPTPSMARVPMVCWFLTPLDLSNKLDGPGVVNYRSSRSSRHAATQSSRNAHQGALNTHLSRYLPSPNPQAHSHHRFHAHPHTAIKPCPMRWSMIHLVAP